MAPTVRTMKPLAAVLVLHPEVADADAGRRPAAGRCATRTRPALRVTRVSPSCADSACTGATRVAARAGSIAEPTVSSRPRPIEYSAALGLTTRWSVGMFSPTALSSAARPWDRPMPAKKPAVDARIPNTKASIRVLPNTWRRVAPTQRSSASSRARCATRIWKVFWMTSAETRAAMMAKTSRKVPKLLV